MKLRARLFAVIYSLSLLVALVPSGTTAATAFSYDTKVTYRVDGGSTAVTEEYSVTNNTARQYLTELKLTTPTESITGLKAAYSDGGNIPAAAVKKDASQGELKYSYQEISITFPRQIYGSGRNWKFSVSYQASGLVESKGSAHTIFIPSIEPGDPGDKYRVELDVPLSYGRPHFTGAPAAGGASGDRQIYTFLKEDLVEQSLGLVFGDSTTYQTNFNFPLSNDSAWPKTVTIALPPDLNNQRSFVNSLEPKPSNTRLDEDGNVLADYKLNPGQKLNVITNVTGEVRFLEYDLRVSGKRSDIPDTLVQKYTKPTRYWPQTPDIIEQAKKLRDDNAPAINTVKATYQYVMDKLSYNDEKIKFNIRQGADKALANPANSVCLEYADLLVALLRAEGIPARMPVGYAYSGSLKQSPAVADSLHAWVEAFVPGIGWMTLDPTWGEKFDQFGKSDMDHFAFAVWGVEDDRPAAVMAGTADLNYQYEKTAIQFQPKQVELKASGSVTVDRYVLLPFVSLDRVRVVAQDQTASDNNELNYGGFKVQLGSLAPAQKLTVNQVAPSDEWNQSSEVRLTQGDVVLASANATVIFWPLYSLGLLLIALAFGTVLRLRANKRRQLRAEQTQEPTANAE